jgi:SET domain-containing protein
MKDNFLCYQQGIGCYMFRIDDTDVVDATMKGSAARFINHSCDVRQFMHDILITLSMNKICEGFNFLIMSTFTCAIDHVSTF